MPYWVRPMIYVIQYSVAKWQQWFLYSRSSQPVTSGMGSLEEQGIQWQIGHEAEIQSRQGAQDRERKAEQRIGQGKRSGEALREVVGLSL